jgi:hypothetical protein
MDMLGSVYCAVMVLVFDDAGSQKFHGCDVVFCCL